MIKKVINKILGSKNSKMLKVYSKRVRAINALESDLQSLSDQELKEKFDSLKKAVEARDTV